MTPVLSKQDLQFQIDQLRKEKMIYPLESIALSLMMVMAAVFLPELLYRVFFSNPNTTLDPNLLNNVAPVAFAIAFVFFAYSIVGNIKRMKMIEKLEKTLQTTKK